MNAYLFATIGVAAACCMFIFVATHLVDGPREMRAAAALAAKEQADCRVRMAGHSAIDFICR